MTLSERKVLISNCNQGLHFPLWRVRGLKSHTNAVLRFPAAPGSADPATCKNRPLNPGDTFFVQEAWSSTPVNGITPPLYKADYSFAELNGPKLAGCKWNAPITMPREYARLYFQVQDVRLERIKDAKTEDLIREGIAECSMAKGCYESCRYCTQPTSPKNAYRNNWDKALRANKDTMKYDANPLTWVITLKKL